jgi:hypothetical protein
MQQASGISIIFLNKFSKKSSIFTQKSQTVDAPIPPDIAAVSRTLHRNPDKPYQKRLQIKEKKID